MNKNKVKKQAREPLVWIRANGRMVAGFVIAALLFGNFVVAQVGDGNFWDNTARYLAEILASDMSDSGQTLGADIADSTYLSDGRPATVVPFENVWVENDLEIGDDLYVTGDGTFSGSITLGDAGTDTITSTGAFTSSATTTLPVNTYCNFKISLTQVATTSAANPAAEGYWCNSGKSLWLGGDWMIDYDTPNGKFASNMTAGTTTCTGTISSSGTCSASLTATTSATLLAATHTATTTRFQISPFNNVAAKGSYLLANGGSRYVTDGYATSTPFEIAQGTCVVINSDWSGATSSNPLQGDQWVTPSGNFCARAWLD